MLMLDKAVPVAVSDLARVPCPGPTDSWRSYPRSEVVAALGAGSVVYPPWPLAGSEPGEEDPAAVARVRALVEPLLGPPAVEARTPPVEWRTWLPGGAGPREEARNLVDAILHEGGGARVVYVVDIHERAVRATVRFGALRPARLEEIGGADATLAVREGRAKVDVDRESVRAFMVAGQLAAAGRTPVCVRAAARTGRRQRPTLAA